MKQVITVFFCLVLLPAAFSQTGIPVPQMTNCDNLVQQFLTQYNIPSATLAIAKDGKLVYSRAFGNANLTGTEATQPYHMFRIASVSKPITAIAIMKMIEDGQLNLSEKAFGPNGILGNHSELSNANVTDNRVFDITVEQLLEHSGGWDRSINCVPNPTTPYSWFGNGCDPIVFPLHVTQELGVNNPVREEHLIRFLMEKGLDFTPGTQFQYSNIGYLTLGLIIEAISGLSYEAYVQQEILEPLGSCDMHIARNLMADKFEREGEYQGNGGGTLSVYGNGAIVPWEYGGISVEVMDAHGGWIATARDLVRLLVAVDGFSTKPDILSAASINSMTSPSANASYYSKGWSINAAGNWWHTGAIDGTASFWARTNHGFTWAIILNKRVIGAQSNNFWVDLDNIPWSCIAQTTSFPTHDLMDAPTVNASNIVFNGDNNSQLEINWDNGNGDKRILIAREGAPVENFPLDGTDYTYDSHFGDGDDLGNGHFVVYNGNGSSVTVSGLDPSATYHFRLFEYNQRASTGNYALYHLCQSPQEYATTSSYTGLADLFDLGIQLYPNPTTENITIEMDRRQIADELRLYNMMGQMVRKIRLDQQVQTVSLKGLSPQIYMASLYKQEQLLGQTKLWKQ